MDRKSRKAQLFLLFCRYSNSSFFAALLRYDTADSIVSKPSDELMMVKNLQLKESNKKHFWENHLFYVRSIISTSLRWKIPQYEWAFCLLLFSSSLYQGLEGTGKYWKASFWSHLGYVIVLYQAFLQQKQFNHKEGILKIFFCYSTCQRRPCCYLRFVKRSFKRYRIALILIEYQVHNLMKFFLESFHIGCLVNQHLFWKKRHANNPGFLFFWTPRSQRSSVKKFKCLHGFNQGLHLAIMVWRKYNHMQHMVN